MYTHITLQERYRLEVLLREGFDQDDIAERLGRTASSISREIERNSKADGSYGARYAHKKARERRIQSKKGSRIIENDTDLAQKIEELLDPLISPETITQEDDIDICFETIYAWISRSRPDLKNKLPYRGKKRRKYGMNRGKKSGWSQSVRDIDERPIEVDNREGLYNWEGDTVYGKQESTGNLLTYTERVSRFEIAILITRRSCDIVHKETKKWFSKIPVQTFTFDRGSEFSLWKMIEEDTGAKVYFAKPHHPWQRGSNENANGRLRRIFPKKFDFSTVAQKDINSVTWKMNHTKRKCLNWRTPCEVFGACCTSS